MWDLGMTAEEMERPDLVSEKVAEVDEAFDLVLISERMEESLVLLADRLCWPLHVVSSLPALVRKSQFKVRVVASSTLP